MASIAEKILAAKAGKESVSPGQIIEADIDYVMVNDVTGMPAFEVFEEFHTEPLRDKIVLIPDHYVPNKDVASAEQAKSMRVFAKKHKIKNYYEVGRSGVCHQLMIEEGFVAPGRLIVGADSHTCSYGAFGAFASGVGSTEAAAVMASGRLWFKVPESLRFNVEGSPGKYVMGKDIILHILGDIGVSGALYKSMEFYGSTFDSLSLSDRITVSNMAIEGGGKAGIFPPDERVYSYLEGRVRGAYKPVYSDEDTDYANVIDFDAADIVSTVAKPHLPSNTAPASKLSDVRIDQAYLGSCTNGRIEDLRVAAEILKGKKIDSNVRLIVVPASKLVYEQALAEGLIGVFLDAEAYVSGPTCGACLGGYMGVLAEGERCVSSTNRNFIGRMGHSKSEVYLASPAVVAASALTGYITDPEDLI
ncbi:MAG: 3-isopropylmalate dehydratase large subunit [Candidatus Altiarchaeales archaeon ex4484_96]|nr:MAG: 3-isopropylmalate dehydratase large subunit [Candidatus Altiarchaeales archaeon ex4484_96]